MLSFSVMSLAPNELHMSVVVVALTKLLHLYINICSSEVEWWQYFVKHCFNLICEGLRCHTRASIFHVWYSSYKFKELNKLQLLVFSEEFDFVRHHHLTHAIRKSNILFTHFKGATDWDTVFHIHKLMYLCEKSFIYLFQIVKICFQDIIYISCPQLLIPELLPWLWRKVYPYEVFNKYFRCFRNSFYFLSFAKLDISKTDNDLQKFKSI